MKRDQMNPAPAPQQSPSSPSGTSTQPANTPTSTFFTPSAPAAPKPVSPDAVKKAKTLVKEANMPGVLWQKVVLDIIDNNPEVAEFISNYLS